MSLARLTGQVHIIGSGLLGTSIALALKQQGVDVSVEDISPGNQALAIDFGGFRKIGENDQPSLVVVCVPPDVTAATVKQALERFESAIVTDVASVKVSILEELLALGLELSRYVGSHPMAGRERGGALSGQADLFVGRPFIICASQNARSEAVAVVEALALDLGASPVRLSPSEHDNAVALVSHLPQLVASLLAGRLAESDLADLSLAGQGLRDTARIAASDPKLWLQILAANSAALLPLLEAYSSDLQRSIHALKDVRASGSIAALAKVLEAGNLGIARLPGKHGARSADYVSLVVMIDDKPGALAKLLTTIGEAQINIEDLKLEHAAGAQVGLVELAVLPASVSKLTDLLAINGYRLAG